MELLLSKPFFEQYFNLYHYNNLYLYKLILYMKMYKRNILLSLVLFQARHPKAYKSHPKTYKSHPMTYKGPNRTHHCPPRTHKRPTNTYSEFSSFPDSRNDTKLKTATQSIQKNIEISLPLVTLIWFKKQFNLMIKICKN